MDGPASWTLPSLRARKIDHLPQRRGDAGGLHDLQRGVPQPQHILGGGDESPFPHEDAGLLRAGDHVGGLAVPADGGQAQRPLQAIVVQHPVEHGGFSGILAHSHDGHGLNAIEQL